MNGRGERKRPEGFVPTLRVVRPDEEETKSKMTYVRFVKVGVKDPVGEVKGEKKEIEENSVDPVASNTEERKVVSCDPVSEAPVVRRFTEDEVSSRLRNCVTLEEKRAVLTRMQIEARATVPMYSI